MWSAFWFFGFGGRGRDGERVENGFGFALGLVFLFCFLSVLSPILSCKYENSLRWAQMFLNLKSYFMLKI